LTTGSEAPLFKKMGQPEDPPEKLFIGEYPLMTANRLFLRVSPGRFR
jgi:hypothetical protein